MREVSAKNYSQMAVLSFSRHREAASDLYTEEKANMNFGQRKNAMKLIIAIATLMLLTVGVNGVAYGDEGPLNRGKTREEVRRELVQAYKDGILPFRRSEYPPSAASMKKNKDAYARAHPEKTLEFDTPSKATSH